MKKEYMSAKEIKMEYKVDRNFLYKYKLCGVQLNEVNKGKKYYSVYDVEKAIEKFNSELKEKQNKKQENK